MTTHSKTVVHTEGEFAIIRWKFWGFRCNSLTTSWIVQNNRTGEQVTICSRLREAKAQVARLATPLRAQLATAVDVDTAARMLAAV